MFSWKYYIGIPWQVLHMQPVSVSQTIYYAPDHYFRLCILTSDTAHIVASLFSSYFQFPF